MTKKSKIVEISDTLAKLITFLAEDSDSEDLYTKIFESNYNLFSNSYSDTVENIYNNLRLIKDIIE